MIAKFTILKFILALSVTIAYNKVNPGRQTGDTERMVDMIDCKHYDEDAPVRLYIANLGKYNEGELVGGWLSLPQEDGFISRFLEDSVLIDGYYEEWAIHDWESDYFQSIDEYDSIWRINEKARKIDEMNGYELDTFKAALEVFGNEAWDMDVDELVLLEGVHTDYDLGYYWAVESGCYTSTTRSLSPDTSTTRLSVAISASRATAGSRATGTSNTVGEENDIEFSVSMV